MEIGIPEIAGVIGTLTLVIGSLWRLIINQHTKERERSEKIEVKFEKLNESHSDLKAELEGVKGYQGGIAEMSERVLQKVSELKINAQDS